MTSFRCTIGLKLFVALALMVSLAATPSVGRSQSPNLEVRGVVKDERGGLIVGAKVALKGAGEVRETQSDAEGRFRLSQLRRGAHSLAITAQGFAAYEQSINLQDARLLALSITLYPTVKENVTIDADAAQAMDPERAAGTIVLKEKDIAALPDDPDELMSQLQNLATSSGSALGGATVTVDGFIVHGRLPPKSAIRSIRINPDLYSAEYDKAPYRGGRIEILTKPGAEAFHGSAFVDFNDSVLNARNAFAITKPQTNTRRFGFDLGGPLVAKRSGFFVDFERREIDEVSTINAMVLNNSFQPAPLSQNVPAPMRLTVGSIRFDWQITPTNTFTARYDFNDNRLEDQGIGGFNLSDRGFDVKTVEDSFRFSDTSVLGKTIVNEARFGISFIHIAERAESDAMAIVVPGAFSSGGATAQSQKSNGSYLEFGDNLSLVTGKHKLKLGTQIQGRISNDTSTDNFNGAFFFGGGLAPQLGPNNQIILGPGGPVLVTISGLEQYRRTLLGLPGGIPTRFSIASGDPIVKVNQWLFSAFAQDEWKFRRNVAISMGLRYEGQTNPADKLSIAPRFGVAYSADKRQHWILRAHVGLFYTRIPDSLAFDVQRLNGLREQQILINNPSFPNPFGGGSAAASIPTIRTLQAGITPEASWQTQIAVEHQLPHEWRLNVSQTYSVGRSVLRTVNVNSPILPLLNGANDPLNAPRPLGVNENILEYQSTGETRGPITFVGFNRVGGKRFNLFSGYLYFHLRSNADSPATAPQSAFTQTGEWARPFWESTHRVFITGTFFLPWKVRASPQLRAASGTPFNITTGIDNNGDGSFIDRPGFVNATAAGAIKTRFGELSPLVVNGNVPRNLGTNPPTIILDLNLARDFALGAGKSTKDERYKLTVNVRASNILNHVNVMGLNGVLTSPFFDRANSAGPARKIELGVRFTF